MSIDGGSLRVAIGSLSRFDLTIAVLIATLVEVEVWSQAAIVGGARALVALLLLVATMTLAWRRRAPLISVTAVATALTAQAALTGRDLNSGGWALALMVVLYSIAAYADTRRALLGLGILLIGLAVRETRSLGSYSHDPMGNAFWWLLIFSWFLVGLYVRNRRRTGDLARVAAEVEVEAAANARLAVTEERQRIARELHDVVAQEVSAVFVQAGAAEELLETDPARARESLRTIQRMSREALSEMRNLLAMMRDGNDDGSEPPQPMLSQLPTLIERHRALGLPTELKIKGAPYPLPPGLEVSGYRIVQEALNNVRQHAAGAPAWVTLTYAPTALDIEVTDEGMHAATSRAAVGHGLLGIEERVRFFGGTFSAGPCDGGGFGIRVRLPTPAPPRS